MEREQCGATRERDFGSHRGGFMTLVCTRYAGHDFRHSDDMGYTWDDEIPETPMKRREHEPKLCVNCQAGSKSLCISDTVTCQEALDTYNAGRADFAAELARTWPEEEECDLEPGEILLRVAELLEEEDHHAKRTADAQAKNKET